MDRVSAGHDARRVIATLRARDAAVDPQRMQQATDCILELRSEFLRQRSGMTLEEIRTAIAADRK